MKKIKALLYCTKAKPLLSMVEYLYGDEFKQKYECSNDEKYLKQMGIGQILNGTIVAECEIEVEELLANNYIYNVYWEYETLNVKQKELLVKSCLGYEQLLNYLRGYNGYALHISNLKVFDKPRELSEYHISYYNKELGMMREKHLEKAPQNMCNAFDINDNYILISIQPQWLCKILNGEKTIEVRKQVLNCMKGNE